MKLNRAQVAFLSILFVLMNGTWTLIAYRADSVGLSPGQQRTLEACIRLKSDQRPLVGKLIEKEVTVTRVSARQVSYIATDRSDGSPWASRF